MPDTWVAYGCSNKQSKGITLFKFPKDPSLKEKWVKQVQRTRDKWQPTPYSRLCCVHFEESALILALL
jgi:hypothetical protein